MLTRPINFNAGVALFMLATGIFLSVSAWRGPDSAMVVPRAVLVAWCAIALTIFIIECRKFNRVTLSGSYKVLFLMATILVASLTAYIVGFLVLALLVVPIILWIFHVRRPLEMMMGTLIVGGGIWFLFHHVLLIRLPALLESGAF